MSISTPSLVEHLGRTVQPVFGFGVDGERGIGEVLTGEDEDTGGRARPTACMRSFSSGRDGADDAAQAHAEREIGAPGEDAEEVVSPVRGMRGSSTAPRTNSSARPRGRGRRWPDPARRTGGCAPRVRKAAMTANRAMDMPMQFSTSTLNMPSQGAGMPKIQSCRRKAKARKKQVAAALERFDDTAPGGHAAAFGAVHEERQGDAGQEEEQRGRHAADELGEIVDAAGLELRFEIGVPDMPVEHDQGADSANPVEVLKPVSAGVNFHFRVSTLTPLGRSNRTAESGRLGLRTMWEYVAIW